MKEWNSKQVANWLLSYGRRIDKEEIYKQYAATFIIEDISGNVLLSMSIDDCIQIGIKKRHATTILNMARGYA